MSHYDFHGISPAYIAGLVDVGGQFSALYTNILKVSLTLNFKDKGIYDYVKLVSNGKKFELDDHYVWIIEDPVELLGFLSFVKPYLYIQSHQALIVSKILNLQDIKRITELIDMLNSGQTFYTYHELVRINPYHIAAVFDQRGIFVIDKFRPMEIQLHTGLLGNSYLTNYKKMNGLGRLVTDDKLCDYLVIDNKNEMLAFVHTFIPILRSQKLQAILFKSYNMYT